jgi:hypothetical protein
MTLFRMAEFEPFILVYLYVKQIMQVMSAGETSCSGKDTGALISP